MIASLIGSALLAAPSLALGQGAAPPTDGRGRWEVGVGLGVAVDLPDAVSGDYARFGPGPSLLVPVRWSLTPNARLRATARGDLGAQQRDPVVRQQPLRAPHAP